MLIASVLWESCWIELDSSFLNLSAPILGLSVDLSIPQKKLVCVWSQSRGVLNCFKAVSRVIPFFFFIILNDNAQVAALWAQMLLSAFCSAQLLPRSHFMVCNSLCLIASIQTHRKEKSSVFCLGRIRF